MSEEDTAYEGRGVINDFDGRVHYDASASDEESLPGPGRNAGSQGPVEDDVSSRIVRHFG